MASTREGSVCSISDFLIMIGKEPLLLICFVWDICLLRGNSVYTGMNDIHTISAMDSSPILPGKLIPICTPSNLALQVSDLPGLLSHSCFGRADDP